SRTVPTPRRGGAGAGDRRFFVELLEKLSRAGSIPEIAETAIKYAIGLIPDAKSGSFLWWDADRGIYRYVAAVGWDLKLLGNVEFKPEELLQERVGTGSDVIIIRNPLELHRKYAHEVLRRFGDPKLMPRAFISVPIEYEGRVIGYFNIDSDDPNAFDEEDLSTMRDFKREIETALALKLGQEELRESEERFRTLFERAPDAIYITDLEGNILDCNEAATRQTGYTREELLRMNIVRDLVADGAKKEYVNEKLARGETVVFEEKKRRKDGTTFYTEVALSPITYRGQRAALSFNRDITWRKRQEERMLRLWRLSRDLFMSKETGDICEKAVSLCQELLDAEFCGIYLDHGEGYRLTSVSGEAGEESLPLFLDAEGANGALAAEDTVVVPLSFEGERLGLFVVKLRDGAREGSRVLIELLALQVANVLQMVRYTRKLEEFADRLERLHYAVTRFNQCESERELCDVAVELLEGLLGFDYCALALREGDYLVPVSHSSKMPASLPRPFRLDEGLGGLTYREQKTFWGDDVRKISAAKPVSADFRAFISVPIGDYGIIQIVSMKEGAFSPEDVKLVEILAQQLYEALKRVRLEREIREQAVKDPLTGLYNRRYYDLFIQLHLKELKDRPLGIAILDMDNFKAVNDLCGHVVGDKVLVELARILRDNVRESDVVIRWGGDEFLILMPGATREEALKAVNRLKQAVSSWTNILCPGVRVDITAGVSSWDPTGDRDLEEALKEADRELYARKSGIHP
ncbi:MAG: diguanylate cyclase, partial [Caldiserica bacterium]|nr:diguanylate cyclase [Caldisericota bacterium]